MGRSKINIALFGLGRIGLMHGKNLMRNKDFNLQYVFDLNKKLTQKVSKILKSEIIIFSQILLIIPPIYLNNSIPRYEFPLRLILFDLLSSISQQNFRIKLIYLGSFVPVISIYL